MDYADVQQLFDTVIPFGEFRCYWKSRFLNGLTDEAIDADRSTVNAEPAVAQHAVVDLELRRARRHGSGRPTRPSATGSMPYMVSFDSIWSDAADDAANIAWTRDVWERLGACNHHDRIYLNFAGHGEDSDELVRRTFGDNFARLTAIKTTYDPSNRFRFNQNIAPAGEPAERCRRRAHRC